MIDRRSTLAAFAAAAAGVALRPAAAQSVAPYQAAAFRQAVESGAAVVVHVHANWCPTCRQQQTTLDPMAADPAFRAVRFVRVDFDAERAFLQANRISNQAVILVFRGGREVARLAGVTDAAQIRDRVRQAALG
jgi:thioredoxin-like negative regulator of GroEL